MHMKLSLALAFEGATSPHESTKYAYLPVCLSLRKTQSESKRREPWAHIKNE